MPRRQEKEFVTNIFPRFIRGLEVAPGIKNAGCWQVIELDLSLHSGYVKLIMYLLIITYTLNTCFLGVEWD